MGNDQSRSGTNRLAITAMSNVTKITKSQLTELRDRCIELSKVPSLTGLDDSTVSNDTPKNPLITSRDFRIAMAEVGVSEEMDAEVLDRLFTMWDKTGDDKVDPILFLVGVSPLASVMDIEVRLQFAFELFDVKKTGKISHGDIMLILAGINATASYFGDAVLTAQQIEIIADDVFKSATAAERGDKINYMDRLDEFSNHPLVVQFASGGGTMRYGTAK
uniref:EF-hand domain-containing protein n=1 Tax=Ditylum brightwellii TaxID=49249 RepID=A0A6U3NZ21_9STRA|mmetsp:Transcript_11870/g.17679  ORF Transcript_11870/g.17679 Transcript_11870/m.17679 type:complete len:219 (-) Transcript_11870:171-827(-)